LIFQIVKEFCKLQILYLRKYGNKEFFLKTKAQMTILLLYVLDFAFEIFILRNIEINITGKIETFSGKDWVYLYNIEL